MVSAHKAYNIMPYNVIINKPSIFIEASAGSKMTPGIGSPGKTMLATTDSENSKR